MDAAVDETAREARLLRERREDADGHHHRAVCTCESLGAGEAHERWDELRVEQTLLSQPVLVLAQDRSASGGPLPNLWVRTRKSRESSRENRALFVKVHQRLDFREVVVVLLLTVASAESSRATSGELTACSLTSG